MATFRENLQQLIWNKKHPGNKLFEAFILLTVVVSMMGFILESVKDIQKNFALGFRIIDWTITIIFTVEYILRIWSSTKPLRYISSFLGLIDVLSIIPTYTSLFFIDLSYLSIVRLIRLLRVFQVFKITRFMGESRKIYRILKKSLPRIVIFVLALFIVCVITGTLLFVIEGPSNGFHDIPTGIYWAIVTLTTVGYGDITPQTPLGKFITGVLMVLGYGLIAVPSSIIAVEWSRKKRKRSRSLTKPHTESLE